MESGDSLWQTLTFFSLTCCDAVLTLHWQLGDKEHMATTQIDHW